MKHFWEGFEKRAAASEPVEMGTPQAPAAADPAAAAAPVPGEPARPITGSAVPALPGMAKFPSPSGGLGGITLGDKHKKTIIAFLEKHVAGDPVMDKVFEGVLPYLSEQPLVVIGQTEPVPAQDPMAEPGLEGGAPAAEEAAPPAEKKPAAKEKAEKKPPKATEKKAQSEHFWAGFR